MASLIGGFAGFGGAAAVKREKKSSESDVADFGRRLHPVVGGEERSVRRRVLQENLEELGSRERREKFHALAKRNLERWAAAASAGGSSASSRTGRGEVRVLEGDWGEVAHLLTRTYGQRFAVLNMANAYVGGGGYTEGAAAQEENMFRRTDCHFSIDDTVYDRMRDRYLDSATDLLNGVAGRVLLDTEHPRVCIRAREDRTRNDLGYPRLPDEEVFPFYELRAAAVDLRAGARFSIPETMKRVEAQLDTLIDYKVRHVVLSAFGCGAFRNPADQVALCYQAALKSRMEHFDIVAFAIFHAGYGPDNFKPFLEVFGTAAGNSKFDRPVVHVQLRPGHYDVVYFQSKVEATPPTPTVSADTAKTRLALARAADGATKGLACAVRIIRADPSLALLLMAIGLRLLLHFYES